MRHMRRISSRTEQVVTPLVATAPNTTLSPTFTGSPFSSNHHLGEHLSTDWEFSTNPGFTNIIRSSLNDAVNKTTFPVSGLTASTTYYLRYRYRSTFAVSSWSPMLTYVSMADNRYIQTPTLSGVNTSWTSSDIELTGSPYTPVNFSDPLSYAEFVVATEANFTSIIASGLSTSVNKTITTNRNFTYVVARVRYWSNGIASAWSPTIEVWVANYQW